MRVGFFVTLFLSAVFVQAAPSPVEERDLVDNVETVIDQLFSVNVGSILSVATPIVESVFSEATSDVGEFLASNTAIASEVKSLLGEATSFLGPVATGLVNDAKNAETIVTPNGAMSSQELSAGRPLVMGAAALLGSMFVGAYAVL